MSKTAVREHKPPSKKGEDVKSLVVNYGRTDNPGNYKWEHHEEIHEVRIRWINATAIVSCRTADVRPFVAGEGVATLI